MTIKYCDYLSKCPECGGSHLCVTQVTLAATGKSITVGSKLEPDGFEISQHLVPGLKDCSTTNEKVLCLNCKKEYDLTDLFIDN